MIKQKAPLLGGAFCFNMVEKKKSVTFWPAWVAWGKDRFLSVFRYVLFLFVFSLDIDFTFGNISQLYVSGFLFFQCFVQ